MYKAVCSSLPLHSGQHSGKAGVDNPSEDTGLFASRLGFIAFTLRSHVETFRGFGGERSRSLATASDIGYAWVRTSATRDVLSDREANRVGVVFCLHLILHLVPSVEQERSSER